MPTMYEIYDRYAEQYHAFVKAEDYKDNLASLLRKEIHWINKEVLEAGTGPAE